MIPYCRNFLKHLCKQIEDKCRESCVFKKIQSGQIANRLFGHAVEIILMSLVTLRNDFF